MAELYYLISNVGTHDCSVETFTDRDEATNWYRDFVINGIDCVLTQECKLDDLEVVITLNELYRLWRKLIDLLEEGISVYDEEVDTLIDAIEDGFAKLIKAEMGSDQ